MEAPKDNLTRHIEFRAEPNGDGRTLEGYAAVFNSPAVIDSWEGHFEETILPGAFKRSIKQKGPKGVRLQFDHGTHPLIGSIPIGAIQELREDTRGLYVSARLSDNWLIEPVRDAIRDGAITGMSFRFRVVKDKWDHNHEPPSRSISEVEVFEIGPVVYEAYEKTSVGVRAREIAEELTDPERRIEVARALLIGTSEEPAHEGTSEEPASTSGSPKGTRLTKRQRQLALRSLNL